MRFLNKSETISNSRMFSKIISILESHRVLKVGVNQELVNCNRTRKRRVHDELPQDFRYDYSLSPDCLNSAEGVKAKVE